VTPTPIPALGTIDGTRPSAVSALAVLPGVDTDGISITDPYVCGAGFTGQLAGGTGPFTLSYSIRNDTNSYDLGGFSVADRMYTSPAGYVDSSVIAAGTYSVRIMVTDSSEPAQSVTLNDSFSAQISDTCEAGAAGVAADDAVADGPSLAFTGQDQDLTLVGLILLATGTGSMALGRRRLLRSRD